MSIIRLGETTWSTSQLRQPEEQHFHTSVAHVELSSSHPGFPIQGQLEQIAIVAMGITGNLRLLMPITVVYITPMFLVRLFLSLFQLQMNVCGSKSTEIQKRVSPPDPIN